MSNRKRSNILSKSSECPTQTLRSLYRGISLDRSDSFESRYYEEEEKRFVQLQIACSYEKSKSFKCLSTELNSLVPCVLFAIYILIPLSRKSIQILNLRHKNIISYERFSLIQLKEIIFNVATEFKFHTLLIENK